MNKNRILIDLSGSEKTQFGKVDFASQTVPQRVFSSIWEVESQVNNGGFSGYFQSNGAETAPFVVQALDVVGARRAAGICRRAIAVAFPAGLPSSPEAMAAAAGELSDDAFDALDREFMKYPDNLTELLFDYVSEHPEQFGPLPKD